MTNEQPVWMHGDMLRGQTRKGSGCEFRTIPVTVKLTRKHRILTVHVHFSNFVATTVFRLCGGDQGFPVALDLRYCILICLCFSDMGHLYAEGLDMIHDNLVEI